MARKVTRRRAFAALWHAFRDSRRPGAPGIGDRLAAVPRMLGARLRGEYLGLGPSRLGMMALAVAYVVSPIDIAPELLLTVFGVADDTLVAMWLAGAVLDEAEQYLAWERRARPHAAADATAPSPAPHHR
jgi:uncharacterized membrane protein YkvA (DUF1232 family)